MRRAGRRRQDPGADSRLRYLVRSAVLLSLGYLRERLSVDNFTAHGFTYVPTTATGAYDATLLAGTVWRGCGTSVVSATVTLTFQGPVQPARASRTET